MKILKFKEFVELPKGTVFQQYNYAHLDSLMIKGETIIRDGEAVDFWQSELGAYPYCHERTIELNNIEGRWALYEDEAEFLVYEPEDIVYLINRITGMPLGEGSEISYE